MSAPQIEIQLIAAVVAVACALPGVFLVLRRMALMSDAISHAILPGIVVAFFLATFLAAVLYGVQARDVLVFAGVPTVLAATAFAAVWIAARRASRIHPLEALRYE